MKKRTFIILAVSILAVSAFFGYLCVGKVKEIKAEDENGIITLTIVRGELIGAGYTLKQSMDADPHSLIQNSHPTLKYINENIVNKGYSNEQALEEIKSYINAKNGSVISAYDKGYGFSGLNWIIQRLSSIN